LDDAMQNCFQRQGDSEFVTDGEDLFHSPQTGS
jgi:hypothetical protein